MIETDQDRSDMLDDWDSAVYKGKVIYGIFEDAYIEFGGVESIRPTLFVKDIDVTDVSQGETININSTIYTIRGNQSEGTGFTLLILES